MEGKRDFDEGAGWERTREEMLMCHKVTHKNFIDSFPLFRNYNSANV